MKLPGRTDNEVKNYWNTRLKRRQRAGQSLYPPDVERDIAILRAHNLSNPFADADGNIATPASALISDPYALPPRAPSSSTSASASHSSPLINQNYPLLNQMQGMQLRHHHANHHPQPAFHHHHHHHHGGGFRSAGLPPLPTRPRQPPSNQINTASCSDGLLEAMLLGDDDQHHLVPHANHAMSRAGSMPELMYGGGASASASDSGDVTSQFPPGDTQDPHHGGKWDFLFGQWLSAFILLLILVSSEIMLILGSSCR